MSESLLVRAQSLGQVNLFGIDVNPDTGLPVTTSFLSSGSVPERQDSEQMK